MRFLPCFWVLFFGIATATHAARFPHHRLPASDTVLKIEAHPAAGFNFPYYLRIPAGVDKKDHSYLLVETNNSGSNDTFAHHEQETYREIIRNSLGSSLCEGLGVPFLMPVFPRPASDWQIYTHAYDKDAAHIKKGPMKRLDLQLIAMCEHAKGVLREYGIAVDERILMNGFSASGTFANRFTAIHPGKVAGVACGGINGIAILPVSKLDGETLCYPIGTADMKKTFGKEFDITVFRSVPQFIYMGALDDNDAVVYDDAYSKAERALVFSRLSARMQPDRFARCQAIYKEHQVNATFKTYPHIGHGTDGLIYREVLAFFRSIIAPGQQ